MAFVLGLFFLAVTALEAPGLVRQKMWKELTVFLSLLVIGAVYSFGQIFDWPLPNPSKGVEAIFLPITEAINKLLA